MWQFSFSKCFEYTTICYRPFNGSKSIKMCKITMMTMMLAYLLLQLIMMIILLHYYLLHKSVNEFSSRRRGPQKNRSADRMRPSGRELLETPVLEERAVLDIGLMLHLPTRTKSLFVEAVGWSVPLYSLFSHLFETRALCVHRQR